ncbi:MAG: hypothetical protein AAF078_02860, partial [Planctomycetota bacterium]
PEPDQHPLRAFGLVAAIGEDNVFPTTYGVFQSARRALERARELVGATVDLDGLLDEDEPNHAGGDKPDGPWAYHI